VPPHAHERPGLEHHVVAERVGKAQLGRACCCTAVGGIGLAQCHRANEKGDSSSQELDGHMVARRGSPVLEAARPPVARPGPTIGPRGGALGGNPLEARSAVRAASDPSPDAPQQVAAICPCQGAMETRSWWQFLRLPPANDDRFGRGDGRGRERRAVRSLTAVEISLHAVYRGPTSARAEGPDPAAMAEATSSEGPVNAASTKPTQQESVWLNAWHDPVAGLKTHGMCVRLVDLYGDGDSKLLVADQERKLTVYKGASANARPAACGLPRK
jgi:hypothetical protein